VDVQFTVSWDNSWRAAWTELASANVSGAELAVENWDAAWVFLKWRNDNNGDWSHTTLAATGHTVPEGTTITVSSDGLGVFIHRSAAGSGSFSKTVKLRWNRVADGAGTSVDVSAHALEMVYVSQGAFEVGTGSIAESGSFTDGSWVSDATIPFLIAGESALTITNSAGNLWGTSTEGNNKIGSYGTLPAAYPKGYNAFYCMKYEVTQGQYADFLNMLTADQAGYRYSSSSTDYRYTISGSHPNFTASAPDRACNFLSWLDGARYAAWAGLRPMTELEYEKACRGVLNATAEFAWGDYAFNKTTGFVNDGTADEAPLPSDAYCVFGNLTGGPIRVGAFATSSSSRKAAGASYWGIMELSGNVWEQAVSAGLAVGRAYTGMHGTGSVDSLPSEWPTISSGGYGVRGGAWNSGLDFFNRVSDRSFACISYDERSRSYGWRGVRTAP
jgi:formylglycine-generating enzyme required for sulfatase activity